MAPVSAVNSPYLKMNLDIYHAQIGEGNPSSLSANVRNISVKFRLPMFRP